ERAKAGHHHVLQIRLLGVDDREHFRCGAEPWRWRTAGLIGRDPHLASVRVSGPWPVVEIFAEQTEFPELVGNILADVSHGAVRADDNFAVLFVVSRGIAKCSG